MLIEQNQPPHPQRRASVRWLYFKKRNIFLVGAIKLQQMTTCEYSEFCSSCIENAAFVRSHIYDFAPIYLRIHLKRSPPKSHAGQVISDIVNRYLNDSVAVRRPACVQRWERNLLSHADVHHRISGRQFKQFKSAPIVIMASTHLKWNVGVAFGQRNCKNC